MIRQLSSGRRGMIYGFFFRFAISPMAEPDSPRLRTSYGLIVQGAGTNQPRGKKPGGKKPEGERARGESERGRNGIKAKNQTPPSTKTNRGLDVMSQT